MLLAKMIAIDGPAASGKSTIAQGLAEQLGYLFFDTGVMYRAATLAAMRRLHSVADEAAVTALTGKVTIDVQPPTPGSGRMYTVLVDGQDVTDEIRGRDVEANVSQVAAYAGVRQLLTSQQRRVGLRGQVVMVGRDIGTVVLPEAECKIFLVASVEERAKRRYAEQVSKGAVVEYADVLRALQQRDATDSGREVAPLRAAADAVLLNTDGLSIEQVLAQALILVSGGCGAE